MKLNLKNPIVFFDLETTGTNINTDRIVEICYLKVFSFNPANKADGKNPFTFTSEKGVNFDDYQAFLNNEARYTRLVKPFPERADKLFKKSEEAAKARYDHLQKLVELYK